MYESTVKAQMLADAMRAEEKRKEEFTVQLQKSEETNRTLIMQFTLVQVAGLYAVRWAEAHLAENMCLLATSPCVRARIAAVSLLTYVERWFFVRPLFRPQPSLSAGHFRASEVPRDHREHHFAMVRR